MLPSGWPMHYSSDQVSEPITIRVTKDMSKQLRLNAERRGISISKYVRYCIEKVLDEEFTGESYDQFER